MEKPHIAAKAPAVVNLKPGTYWWCSCGLSKDQPFCDGSHKGSRFGPQKYELTEERNVAFCQCKYSNNKPLCDGSHKNL